MRVKQFRDLLSNLDDNLEVKFRDCHGNDNDVEIISLEWSHNDDDGHEHYEVVIS